MRIFLILIFILFSNIAWAFIDYTYFICERENETSETLTIDQSFIFLTFKQGNYVEEIVEINKTKSELDVLKTTYKKGHYTFNENTIILKESLYFRKPKFKKQLDRKSLKLVTFNKGEILFNHNCTITNFTDYEKKVFENVTKLKEIWKNEYKNNKI